MRNRRPVLLLEVVIAAFLLALVAVPLLRPSVGMLIREKRAIRALRVEERYSEVHGEVMVALYRKEIGWDQIIGANWQEGNGCWFRVEDAGHKPRKEGMAPLFYKMWIEIALERERREVQNRRFPVMLEHQVEEVSHEE